MNKKVLQWMFIGSIMGAFIATSLFQLKPIYDAEAATITPGYTFATNEQVTAAKLGTLVSGATISAIGTSDLADGSITTLKLGANSVTGAKIVDGTIESGDISNRTIAAVNIATNAITGIELNTNITTRAGFVDLSLSTLTLGAGAVSPTAVAGVTNSAGAADSGKIVKLNPSGQLDGSFFNRFATNVFLAADTSPGSAATTTVLSYTTTLGTGAMVFVQAQMALKGNGDIQIGRLTSPPNVVDNLSDASSLGNYTDGQGPSRYSMVLGPLVTNVTINLQVITTAAAGATVYRSKATAGTGNPIMSNITYMTIQEFK